MKQLSQDLSIFKKLNLIKEPVGVKFLYRKPEGIGKLDRKMALCTMLKEAQESKSPFYVAEDNEDCVGAKILGMSDMPAFAEAGEIGAELEIFEEPRANSRIYNILPKLSKGVVNYVAFSRLGMLTFNPDLLILTATPSQAEIVLRASSFTTGALYSSKSTLVMACAWLYVYPYLSGKLNYIITGISWGMKILKVFPEGLILISIPYDLLPQLTQNLKYMNWSPSAYTQGLDEYWVHFKCVLDDLSKKA